MKLLQNFIRALKKQRTVLLKQLLKSLMNGNMSRQKKGQAIYLKQPQLQGEEDLKLMHG
jgi:hypothetical protein